MLERDLVLTLMLRASDVMFESEIVATFERTLEVKSIVGLSVVTLANETICTFDRTLLLRLMDDAGVVIF